MLTTSAAEEDGMRASVLGLTAAALVVSAGAAFAALDADSAIKYRKGVFEAIGGHFGGIIAGMKSPELAPDMLAHAEALAASAKMPWKAFGPGTDKGSEKTTAGPKIWSDAAGFKAAAAKLETSTADLLAAVKSKDAAKIGAAVQATGAACKQCHEGYRVR
jgi:cytochrome c556